MLARVTVTDWELGGARRSVELRLVSETMTMREFLRRRLVAEAEAEARAAGEARAPLEAWCVKAGATEQALNGSPRTFGPTSRPWTDDDSVEGRLGAVEAAFQARCFVALFDGSQIGDLDQLVTVRDDSKATFIRLVPLVGG